MIAHAKAQLAACETKLVQHTVQRRNAKRQPIMTGQQIRDLVTSLGDIVGVFAEADPADRAEVYRQLGLRLTYHPDQQKVRVQANPEADIFWEIDGVQGLTQTKIPDRVLLDIEVYIE